MPLPHAGLVPANRELPAARVGSMVGDRVPTREYLHAEIARADLAGPLGQLAARIRREDLEAAVRRIAGWAAGELSPAALREAGRRLPDGAVRPPRIAGGPPQAAGSSGRSETTRAPSADRPAIATRRVAKPAAFTSGPSAHTARPLTPNDTARRIPLTRERIRSST